MSYIDENGREVLDDTPVALPVSFKRPPTLQEQMRAMIKQMSIEASQEGAETLEEADDFDIGDDYDPTSPYEVHFDHLSDDSQTFGKFFEEQPQRSKEGETTSVDPQSSKEGDSSSSAPE